MPVLAQPPAVLDHGRPGVVEMATSREALAGHTCVCMIPGKILDTNFYFAPNDVGGNARDSPRQNLVRLGAPRLFADVGEGK